MGFHTLTRPARRANRNARLFTKILLETQLAGVEKQNDDEEEEPWRQDDRETTPSAIVASPGTTSTRCHQSSCGTHHAGHDSRNANRATPRPNPSALTRSKHPAYCSAFRLNTSARSASSHSGRCSHEDGKNRNGSRFRSSRCRHRKDLVSRRTNPTILG